jgi:TonB family protein
MQSRFLLLAVAVAGMTSLPRHASAQSAVASEKALPAVALIKLSPPVYPPLARQARITGDVLLRAMIRRDGALDSAEVIRGHPILKQAALDSARSSSFECRNCEAELTPFLLTFVFDLQVYANCCDVPPRETEVVQSVDRIYITAPNVCMCDPRGDLIRVRSAKCLYLWKCAVRAERVE